MMYNNLVHFQTGYFFSGKEKKGYFWETVDRQAKNVHFDLQSQSDTKFHHFFHNNVWFSMFRRTFLQSESWTIWVKLFFQSSLWINCEELRLVLNHINNGTDSRRVPLQDEDHPGNDPHVVPDFPPLCSGIIPERSRSASVSAGSRENHLIYTKQMRDSWDSFSVTLPSIHSKTSVISSTLNLGTDVFRDWPFLGCFSCISLGTAASFCFFFNVAFFRRENTTQLWRLKFFLFLYLLDVITTNVIL